MNKRYVIARPLRKVIERKQNEYGSLVEILECGHEQHVPYDAFGRTNAYRRRCRKCASSNEEVQPEQRAITKPQSSRRKKVPDA